AEVWVVYADLPQQLSRIMERDHVDITEAERRIGAQMPLAQKLHFAQVVIDNRGTLDELKDVVTQLWQKAQNRAKQGDG
ncbi:MAG: dephospho-CoA kinase, partial [Firmicutes bacterium]|nr:dephospho-CoA kinase [Bacillota bacterium]